MPENQKKHKVTTPQHRRDLFATRVRVTKILWPRWKANELVSPTAFAGWHQPDLWIWMRLEKDAKIPRGYVSIYWIPQNSQNLGIFPVFKRTAYQHIQYLVERTWKNCRFTSAVSQTSSRLGQNKKTHRLHDVFGPLWALSTLHELLLGGIQLSDPVCKFTNNNTPTVKRELMGFYIYIYIYYRSI